MIITRPIIIVPCCGESKRFKGVKKQFLQIGKFGDEFKIPLPIYSASGLTGFSYKVFVFIETDFKNHYKSWDQFIFNSGLNRLILLRGQTENVAETINKAIFSLDQNEDICPGFSRTKTPIYIKDCDNYFETKVMQNCISTTYSSHNYPDHSKSYCMVTSRMVDFIMEKRHVSTHACAGGYGFASSAQFLSGWTKKAKYCSDVINNLIQLGDEFVIEDVKKYTDYGNQSKYDKFIKSLKNDYKNRTA